MVRLTSLAVVSMLVVLVGCTKTRRHDVAIFEPSPPAKLMQPAPANATYTVRFRAVGEADFERIRATEIYVPRGTTLGFERTDTTVFAMAGPVRYELDVPADATLKWWTREKRPTRFAKNMKRFGDDMGQFAIGAAAVVGLGVLSVVEGPDHECRAPCHHTR